MWKACKLARAPHSSLWKDLPTRERRKAIWIFWSNGFFLLIHFDLDVLYTWYMVHLTVSLFKFLLFVCVLSLADRNVIHSIRDSRIQGLLEKTDSTWLSGGIVYLISPFFFLFSWPNLDKGKYLLIEIF